MRYLLDDHGRWLICVACGERLRNTDPQPLCNRARCVQRRATGPGIDEPVLAAQTEAEGVWHVAKPTGGLGFQVAIRCGGLVAPVEIGTKVPTCPVCLGLQGRQQERGPSASARARGPVLWETLSPTDLRAVRILGDLHGVLVRPNDLGEELWVKEGESKKRGKATLPFARPAGRVLARLERAGFAEHIEQEAERGWRLTAAGLGCYQTMGEAS